MINQAIGHYSDLSYGTATAIYILAMLLSQVEQSFGRSRRVALEKHQAAEKVLVGAGGPAETEQQRPPSVPKAGRPERFGRMSVAVLILGALFHLAAIVLRGIAADRLPWGNMYEYITALTFIGVVTWLVVLRRYPLRHLSVFVLLPVVILLFVGGTALYTTAAPVQPALQSYWLAIHVSAAIIASGIFMVPGVASVMYLVRSAHERNPKRFSGVAGRIPDKDVLDRLAYRTTVLAFPIYTFGVLCGAVWAEAAWGRAWGWDPKETVAFVAWVIYAAYLHARATAGWRGQRAAVINATGWAFIVFNLFFINLVTAGLHSYAGVG